MGKKSLALEYFQAPPYDVILNPFQQKGRWWERFGRHAPLHVEIGMGLGQFITEFAKQRPDYNHLGLEMRMHRIYTARNKALRNGVRNIRYVPGDADCSLESFEEGEVSRLTILFPDPWPDPKKADRRLTAPEFIALYKRLLVPGGLVHFRTDDPDLFLYSLETFKEGGFELHIAVPLDRIVTDFEKRWLREGRQIYALDATLPST